MPYESRKVALGIDPVSGLPNREQFAADLRDLHVHHTGETRQLVLVDPLEMSWAHDMTLALGLAPFERLIRCIAQRLCRYLEGIAPVYQIGVKRFAFLLPEPVEGFDDFIETLVATLRQPSQIEGIPVRPSLRAGAVRFQVDREALGDVLRKAMYAVEQAQQGRQPWALYDAVHDNAYRRAFNLISDIGPALAGDQLKLVFQPRFAIPDGTQVSAEALIRWNHPRLGPIFPDEFIPVLERNGLIHGLTRWVIETGLRTLAQWSPQTASKLSINLSPHDFDGHDLCGLIQRACVAHGIEPDRLEVEITEGEWLRSNPQVLTELAQLRAMGVDVAIDDFGTGYSNFSYLHQIPANVVKLDKSLITDLEHNPRHQMIARSVIQLARELGYRTVAEGVETFKCLQWVRSFGCDEAQGYFFARPMPEQAFVAWSRAAQFPLAH
ncbi:putative bifunctional diguanylate cyclase/phosphodiesterase [Pseudomonas abieticivorans]|uniref:putative bifunctional diguanylate cyclase/phosphodiesterase n=1 Tax=Pseudomonas abieticivorans TaxID=2931382 RepID=UPI0020BF4983|nr:bifunctional diguanylate cyclase/phosphodiesterase [Pseudomonas sp. PIA16]